MHHLLLLFVTAFIFTIHLQVCKNNCHGNCQFLIQLNCECVTLTLSLSQSHSQSQWVTVTVSVSHWVWTQVKSQLTLMIEWLTRLTDGVPHWVTRRWVTHWLRDREWLSQWLWQLTSHFSLHSISQWMNECILKVLWLNLNVLLLVLVLNRIRSTSWLVDNLTLHWFDQQPGGSY